MLLRAVLSGDLQSHHGLYWNFFLLGFLLSHFCVKAGAPLGRIFQRGSHVSSLDPSGEIQAYPSFYKINFPDFHCLFNLSWYQMSREEESFNSWKYFSALVKISPCSKFKKFKTNKAIFTIVIGLKNILHWNLVKSALGQEDKSVPVYSPLFNFLFVVSVCNVFV